jgi:uncharacterized linocin/CFP29 family protein
MDPALEQIGWTEEQWNRISTTVTDEAQRARVAAQILPVVGPEDPTVVAIPAYTISYKERQPAAGPPAEHMEVSSDPTLYLTTISVLVEVRLREAADPALSAALTMFRRAANVIARAEDALAFNGRTTGPEGAIKNATVLPPIYAVNHIPAVVPEVTGLLAAASTIVPIVPMLPTAGGTQVANAIFQAIGRLDAAGFSGPYGCALDQGAFDAVCTPLPTLVLPRDRILPFLQGGALVRASTIPSRRGLPPVVRGAIVALSGSLVELVVATDINVTYLQTTAAIEPRIVFRVSERIALRIKDPGAIAVIT